MYCTHSSKVILLAIPDLSPDADQITDQRAVIDPNLNSVVVIARTLERRLGVEEPSIVAWCSCGQVLCIQCSCVLYLHVDMLQYVAT